MDPILGFILNPVVIKTALLALVGYALKKWPDFVNKAIPAALLVVSALLQVLQEVVPPGTANAGVEAAAAAVPLWKTILTGVVAPTVLSIGLHSKWKNWVEWGADGYRVFQESRLKK